jgi:hypothetical protein
MGVVTGNHGKDPEAQQVLCRNKAFYFVLGVFVQYARKAVLNRASIAQADCYDESFDAKCGGRPLMYLDRSAQKFPSRPLLEI